LYEAKRTRWHSKGYRLPIVRPDERPLFAPSLRSLPTTKGAQRTLSGRRERRIAEFPNEKSYQDVIK